MGTSKSNNIFAMHRIWMGINVGKELAMWREAGVTNWLGQTHYTSLESIQLNVVSSTIKF